MQSFVQTAQGGFTEGVQYIHEIGHPWPGQEFCLHIMYNLR